MVIAVIFDFDGVLVDSERKKFNDLKIVLRLFNLNLKSSDFQKMLGRKTDSFLSAKFPNLSKSKIKTIVKLRRQKQLSKIPKLMPGAAGLIKFLKLKKIKTVITTGSSRALVKSVLKKNSAEQLFDLIIAGNEFKKSKPSPECYKVTLKKLILPSEKVVVIEDSVVGIKAAKTANCKVIGVMTYLSKEKLSSAKADFVFKDNKDVLGYFKKNRI